MNQNNSNLISKYWKNKLLNREINTGLHNKKSNVLNITIESNELHYFNKLTNNNPIAQYTVISAIYNFFLKRFVNEFVGFLVSNYDNQSNTLVLSFPVDLKLSFKDYLQTIKLEILETLNHANFNKEIIAEKTGFNNLSFLSNYGININSDVKSDCNGLLFDIKISDNQDLEINASYLEGFINPSIVDYLVQHFKNFLINLENNLEINLSLYPLLTDAEKQHVLVDFNNTEVDYPKNKTIVDLFEEQVENTPNNIAIVFEESKLTYKELNEKANQLANCISSKHTVSNGDIIGVFLPKSDIGIISLLAILKLGAVYLPIDTNYPQERINYLINDSGLKLLISDSVALDINNCDIIDIKAINFDGNSIDNINAAISSKDLAYVIYTSGSTGQPKGVMVEHTSNINMSLDQIRSFEITESDKVVWFASVSFDASISEIMMSLYSGATLCIPTEETIKDKNEFVRFLKETKSTVVTFPPSYLGLLSENDISGLRCVITAGESANPTKVIAVVESGIDYYNAYGPTECAVCVSIYKTSKNDFDKSVIPIGKPISNTKIYILDEVLQPLPIGVAGKIYVLGAGVARGYLNKPELTSEKFVANTFQKGERMYDTGDLGCWLADGNIEFLGRKDQQVKIRGYRIELGEIENIISQYSEDLKQVVVEVKENNQEKVLVVYLVSTTNIGKSELRSFLQNRLPDYMVPGFYVELEKLPLTPNGKIDRKALPGISGDDIIRREYVAPRNEVEKSLVAIWQEVLGIDKIGITDNFFELGGHSLIMSQVINRSHKQLGQTVSFKVFFASPTIKGLSEQLQINQYRSISKAPESESYPLTASQSRLWILSQLEGGSLAYNMPAAVKLTGTVDVNKFEESFQLLIQRHEILRTYFKINQEGEVRQYVVPTSQVTFKIEEKDFSLVENQEEKIADYLQERNNKPFDLEQAQLVRASLIKSKKEEYVFFLSLHHIIGDGWSIEILISEVVKTYNALIQGNEINLLTLSIQYKDYAVWLNEELQEEKYKASEQYWLQQFEGELPVLDLPSFKTRPLIQTYNGESITHQFSRAFLDKLKIFSKEQDVTLFITLMAGINALLHRYTGQDDIIIGTPIAGREYPDLENQMGLYLNTLAIRTQLKEGSSFLDLIAVLKESLLGAYDHQSYPFDELVGKLNLKRDTSRSALFDVLVVLQNQSQLNNLNNEELSNIEISDYEFKSKTAQLDVSFTFVEKDGLELSIEYNTSIYDKYLINRIFSHYENLVDQLIENPEKEIQEIDYLTDKEQLIVKFNDTDVSFQKNETLVDLFEKQSEKNPEDVAVVNEDSRLTYKELNENANQLGAYLREKYNIVSDDLIGIKFERSSQMIVAILGILKSGAAFVYFDPTYPKERISFLQKDSKVKIILDEFEIEDFYKKQSNYKKTNLLKINNSQSLAYVIYTSGTTGYPKGVMVEHRNVVNTLFAEIDNLRLINKVNTCTITNPSFDVSILEVFIPFFTGGIIYIPNHETIIVPDNFLKYVNQHPINLLQGTPTYWKSILNESIPSENQVENLCIGGESLEPSLLDKFSKYFKKAKINNNYGPTETTIDAIVLNDVKEFEFNCIGKPIANTQVYILDKNKKVVPIGVKGIIYIGGEGVSRGYLNNSKLTNEKFFNLKLLSNDTRVYDTGDLGTWLPDGSILFFGRKDEQVKIRGYRVELSEIEQNILGFSNEISQVVVDVKIIDDEQQLVAYYIIKNDVRIDISLLNIHLATYLPNYMIPSFYISIDAIPLNSSGKINKKELPNPDATSRIRKEYVGPSNQIELQLTQYWQEILHIEKIGTQENFFDLGGNSLKVVRLFEKIKNNIYQDITVGQIFSNSTINQQSNLIQKNKAIFKNELHVNELDF